MHRVGHSYSYGYRLASGICWGTVTVSARLASETWSKAKAGAQSGADPGEGLWGLKPPPSKLMIFISS